MKYRLEDLPCISAQARECLSSHGIHSADDILLRLSLPKQRKEFSKVSQIPVEDLTRWAGVADLIRIKGMGIATAELLVSSGQVNSLQQFIDRMILELSSQTRATTGWQVIQKGLQNLVSFFSSRSSKEIPKIGTVSSTRIAEREAVRTAAQTLRQNLSAFTKQDFTPKYIPNVNQLAEMAEEAVELRPRLVMDKNDGSALFGQTMKSRAWRMCKTILGLFAILWGIMVISVVGTSLINIKQMRDVVASFQVPTAEGFEQLQLYSALLNVSGDAFMKSSLIFAAVMLLFMTLAFIIAGFSPMFVTYPSSTLLMNNAVHRSFFIKAIQVPLRNERRTSLIAIALIALIALPLVMYLFYIDFDMSLQSLTRYSIPVAIFGGLIGVIGGSAMYHHILTGIHIDWERERESLKRYLLYMLVHVIYGAVGIYLLIYSVFTGTSAAYNLIYEQYIRPGYYQALNVTCDEQALRLADSDNANPLYETLKDHCIQDLKPTLITRLEPAVRMVDPDSPLWSQGGPGMSWAVNTIMVWMFLTGAMLLFVLPYLSVGGWWRGIFYILLLAMASRLENFLGANSATVLGLEADTFGTNLVIGFFILTSALLFDWVYDALTEKKKVCPNCQSLIDDHSYCPICGLVQQ